jgi:glycosyltransferase involved in cell wall biosynthesis
MSSRTTVAIVGTVGVPACYGGFETLAANLAESVTDSLEYTIFCSSKAYKKHIHHYANAKLVYVGLKANGMQSVLYDSVSLVRALRFDAILLLGVSGAIALPFLRLVFHGRIITNVDGVEWKREKWSPVARRILHFSEMLAVLFSDLVIADNKAIVDHIKEAYGRKALLIEYGGDRAMVPHKSMAYDFLNGVYAISVCRIVPENNVEMILQAFSRGLGMPCVIVGNWSASSYGKELKRQFSGKPNLHLLDPIYDPGCIDFLRASSALYIHGHKAGGTNPSLVEAMALGLPIIAYDVIYNRETTENQCLYFGDADSLGSMVSNITKEERTAIGLRMEEIAKRRYLWLDIIAKYEHAIIDTLP